MWWWRRQRYAQLEIEKILEHAEQVAEEIVRELPNHDGLHHLAGNVIESVREADRCTRAMSRPWSLHRLPPYFLITSIALLLAWLYWQFLHVASVEVALPSSDAAALRAQLDEAEDLRPTIRITAGSRENIELLMRGEVDIGFVQGGIEIPAELPRHELPARETVLLFVRPGLSRLGAAKVILTSIAEQGSHSVLQDFLRAARIGTVPSMRHEWAMLSSAEDYAIPEDVDAVFVVKDLASDDTARAVRRLADAGFTMTSPSLGVRGEELEYLEPIELPRGHILDEPAVPKSPVRTYEVAAYVAAKSGLRPSLLAAVHRMLADTEETAPWLAADPTDFETAGQVLGAIKSLLDLLIFIGLAFLALLGLEIASYRRRFHQLNTIISLIGIHQGNKDLLDEADPDVRRRHLLYLARCIDLLSLIDTTAGYYVQRNGSLLYSNLLTAVTQRSSNLKLAILMRMQQARGSGSTG